MKFRVAAHLNFTQGAPRRVGATTNGRADAEICAIGQFVLGITTVVAVFVTSIEGCGEVNTTAVGSFS